MKPLKVFLLIMFGAAIAFGTVALDGNKTWTHFEGDTADYDGWHIDTFFIQDKETGTRCYAVRGPDAVAISCVPKGQ